MDSGSKGRRFESSQARSRHPPEKPAKINNFPWGPHNANSSRSPRRPLSRLSLRLAAGIVAANELTGSENLLFNQALAELQNIDVFLNAWHHARVQYDMSNYSGSVWVDDQPVISNVPLNTNLKVKSPAEISIQGGPGIPLKLWLDDVEVKFIDQSSPQPDTEVAAFMPVLRDHFSRYESGLFPSKGGWLDVLGSAITDMDVLDRTPGRESQRGKGKSAVAKQLSADNAQAVDESEYVSSGRSFRLENKEAGPAYVSKKISLPPRIPFVVSADNFSIVQADIQALENGGPGGSRSDTGREKPNDDRREGKQNPVSSQRDKNTASPRPSSDAQKLNGLGSTSTAPKAKSTTKTFSASPAGGTYYIYSFDGKLLAEYDLYGQCVRDYIYFGGRLIAEYDTLGAQYYYYMSDQINSTRIVTNGAGVVVYAAAHDPYGGIQTPQGWPSAFNPTPKFSGKERDGESELDYFGARYYDRAQYRFISVDPVMTQVGCVIEPDLWNYYAYCGENPLTNIDQTGRWKTKVHYNVTYAAMMMAFEGWDPNFARGLADMVASACAGVDLNPSTSSTFLYWEPVLIGTTALPWPVFADKEQRKKWHFPSDERYEEVMDIAMTTLDPIEFGKALHVIQDAFSHASYDSGHFWQSVAANIFGARDPDNPIDFWDPALAMAYLTLDLCYSYEQRLEQFFGGKI